MCQTVSTTAAPLLWQTGEVPERLRLWEIDPLLRCPVVGTCLSQAEQKRLLKEAGALTGVSTPFDMHETLVAALHTEERLSFLVDEFLENKYRDEAACLWILPERELLARWRAALEAGQYEAVLWGASVRPELSFRARRELFSSLHMLMHSSLEQVRELRRDLALEREQRAETDAAHGEAVRDRDRLLRETAKMNEAGGRSATRKSKRDRPTETAGLEARINSLEEQLAATQREMTLLSQDNEQLTAQLEAARRQASPPAAPGGIGGRACGTGECPTGGLCGRRVLIVGGLDRMEPGYRSLVEAHGGVCEHHTGCCQGGRRKLETSVRRADIVICLAGCNSHAACLAAKGISKKMGKPIKMLGNSSLSSVSEVLQENIARS